MQDERKFVQTGGAPAAWLPGRTMTLGLPAGIRKMGPFGLVVPPIADSLSYRLHFADSSGWRGALVSETARFDLASIWDRLAPGYVRYNVIGYGKSGAAVNAGKEGHFIKGTPICVRELAPPLMAWHLGSRAHFRYLAGLPNEDESEKSLPIWLRHAWVRLESGKLAPVAYPSLHYPFHIWSLLRYQELDPDPSVAAYNRMVLRALFQAVQSSLTPTTWHWAGYVPSTIGKLPEGAAGETEEVLQPLKAATLGVALLDLASLDQEFSAGRRLATSIAEQLAANQREDGALPFRVNGRTGEWLSGESSAVGFAMILWRRLRDQLDDHRFDVAEKRALSWLLKGPVATRRWIGNYEDVATEVTDSASANLNNYDAIMTALYLVKYSADGHDFLDRAREIEEWVENEFMFTAPEPPIEPLCFVGPVVMEQSLHFYPIDFHAANLARLEWALYDATGDARYQETANALLNALTHYLDARGRPLSYAPDPDVGYGYSDVVWFGCAAGAWLALSEGALRTGEQSSSSATAFSGL